MPEVDMLALNVEKNFIGDKQFFVDLCSRFKTEASSSKILLELVNTLHDPLFDYQGDVINNIITRKFRPSSFKNWVTEKFVCRYYIEMTDWHVPRVCCALLHKIIGKNTASTTEGMILIMTSKLWYRASKLSYTSYSVNHRKNWAANLRVEWYWILTL